MFCAVGLTLEVVRSFSEVNLATSSIAVEVVTVGSADAVMGAVVLQIDQ